MNSGFTDNDTLEAQEDRGIEYKGRLRNHSRLQVLALDRKHGSAEVHMAEVKSALDVHLS
ncbi:hypothetical protein Q427_19615 [Halomonas sp. BC04]|nr:hypothetical protein Q427_19615 [Halomonas sp. BC04]